MTFGLDFHILLKLHVGLLIIYQRSNHQVSAHIQRCPAHIMTSLESEKNFQGERLATNFKRAA